MNLKATILLLILASACAAPLAAQGKKKKGPDARPDFGGTWALDLKKSGYDNARPALMLPVRLVITHGEPEVRVTRTFPEAYTDGRAVELVYYTDDRGEKNAVNGRDRVSLSGAVESHTKWKGSRLVIRGTEYLVAFGDTNKLDFTERWELSADGAMLTQTRVYDVLGGRVDDVLGGPRGDPRSAGVLPRERESVIILPSDSKRVYNRAP
jgi:hypothetical protein